MSIRSLYEGDQSPPLEPDPYSHYCKYARQFAEWVQDKLLAPLAVRVTEQTVVTAEVQLQREFFRVWGNVPVRHRTLKGHVCVIQVWEETYKQMLEMSAFLRPPPVYPPRPKRLRGDGAINLFGD